MAVAKSKAEIEAEAMDFCSKVITDKGIELPLSIENQQGLLSLLDAQNSLIESQQKLLQEMDDDFWEAVEYIKFWRIQKAMIVIFGIIIIIQSFRLM